jgi:UDP-N-acetylmuramoyl-L-alanyl-D-glutamate--2,6-diaminopimelate ligase
MFKELLYRIKRIYHLFTDWLLGALPANLQYGFPSKKLKVIMITGTDGKTTSSTMTYKVLLQAGKKVGLISTVAAFIGSDEIDTGFHVTTPGPWQLQKLLRMLVDKGYEYVVLEATSHGIYQFRTWGITPLIAGLTNITQNEALDYHVTYKNYVDAKANMLRTAHSAWINAEDESYKYVHPLLDSSKIHSYSALQNVPSNIKSAIQNRFQEAYNHANATMVYHITHELGVSDQDFELAIEKFDGVKGRMQAVENDRGLHIVVDFAHTPNALYQALTSLKKKNKEGKLIAIFGCAGLRDPRKRAPMGKWATQLADYAIFTAEDPRTEDIWSIIRQMKEQIQEGHRRIISIPDREQAISFALEKLAKKGDTIAVFGKGHEQSMAYGSIEYPWNDITSIERML